MLGFFNRKRAPVPPAEFVDDVIIGRPAADVYALIDWADPRNAQRALGNDIAVVDAAAGRYRVRVKSLPFHRYAIAVSDAQPDSIYAFGVEAQPRIGRIQQSHERYVIEPLDEQSCRLTTVNSVMFVDKLTLSEIAHERLVVTAATHNALAKLKILAEQGVEAVRAVEGKLII